MLPQGRPVPEKTSPVYRQSWNKAMPGAMYRAQGSSHTSLWHRGGRTFQPTWPRPGRLQLPTIRENPKQGSLRPRGQRKLLDPEVWSSEWGRNEQEELTRRKTAAGSEVNWTTTATNNKSVNRITQSSSICSVKNYPVWVCFLKIVCVKLSLKCKIRVYKPV